MVSASIRSYHYGAAISFPWGTTEVIQIQVVHCLGGLNSTTASPQLHELNVLSRSARSIRLRLLPPYSMCSADIADLVVTMLCRPYCLRFDLQQQLCVKSQPHLSKQKSHVPAVAICRPLSSPVWNASLSIKCPRYCKHFATI